MNIIICGAGRVGFTIAKQLSEQGHSITVIDTSSEDIQKIDEALDVKAIVGKLETLTDPRTLQLALKEVYELIVVEGKQDVRDGLSTLNKYTGREAPVFKNKYSDLRIGDDGIFNVADEDK